MKRIDIEKVIREKAPKLDKKLPRWVKKVMAWLICQKQLNDILEHCDMNQGVDFAISMSKYMKVTYTVNGMENLDKSGHMILVSNHPLGAYDGISYIACLGKKFKDFKVIVNDILMAIDPLHPVFLPVNTLGRQKRADMEKIQEAFQSQETQIMTFPAGFCSRYIDGKIQDIEWHSSVIKQAVQNQRDVIPMHFKGRNSITFYGVEWLRRQFGMKFNIGLILLPWQMVKTARGKHYTITIGAPIPWQTFDDSKTPDEWAQWLRSECYKLAN